jgi:hypothetical protein
MLGWLKDGKWVGQGMHMNVRNEDCKIRMGLLGDLHIYGRLTWQCNTLRK